MAIYYQLTSPLFGQGKNIQMELDGNHPFIKAATHIDWEGLFDAIQPIIYRSTNPHIGRRLNIRAHCGIYLLQSASGWTDRLAEDMLRHHGPTRIFCGLGEGTFKGLDHTRIEKFRNRLGTEGAEVMNHYLLHLAVKRKFTDGKHVDMDTTVQEAGIAYPTDMNLMKKFQQRSQVIVEAITGGAGDCIERIRTICKKGKDIVKEYQFFAKAKEKKAHLMEQMRQACLETMKGLREAATLPGISALRPAMRKELERLFSSIPTLLRHIKRWLRTGTIASGKMLSLHKAAPRYLCKGKLGKEAEIGRKWVVNQLTNGFLMVFAPENPALADAKCVKPSIAKLIEVFGEVPESYGTDRGMYSKKNIRLCRNKGIAKIGIQPKGNKPWEVDRETAREMYCRRAGIEPRIGIAGKLGLKRSRAKTDSGDLVSGHRAALGFNLKKLFTCWA